MIGRISGCCGYREGFQRPRLCTSIFIKIRVLLVTIVLAAIAGFACVRAEAAAYHVSVEGGAMVRVGDTAKMVIQLIPAAGDDVIGGQCTVSVDPALIELSGERSEYAADAAFTLVERFQVDPEKGMVTFRAQSKTTIAGTPIFLKVPFSFRTEGSTYINLTSSVIYADGKSAPSNPGYFKLYGYEGEEPDPVLYAAMSGDNVLLTTESLGDRFKVVRGGAGEDAGASLAQMDLGLSALEEAKDEAAADVVIGFSKRTAKIGLRQWVRLDIVIEKFPENEMMTGIELKVKYDPSYLMLTDNQGREAAEVEVQEALGEMTLDQLKARAKDMGLVVSSSAKKEDIIALIDSARRWKYRSVFTMPFTNKVDKTKGEIMLSLLAGLETDPENIKTPMPVVSLLFKGLRQGTDIPVTMEDVLVPVRTGTQYVRNARVTIDPSQKGCDQTLPAALCAGSFKIAGNVSFTIEKAYIPRTTFIRNTETGEKREIAGKTSKFKLDQAWNVLLDGSLRNGISINGTLSESPQQVKQHLDVEINSNTASVHFGSFAASFESGSYINLDKQIDGLQFTYKAGKFDFTSMTAETKSTTKSEKITGKGTTGPYNWTGGFIIPGTLHIFDGDNKEIPPSKYSVDYGKRDIYFTEARTSGEPITLTYELATFLFSTGNINAFRLGYTSGKKENTSEKTKIGVAYIMSTAPKSMTRAVVPASKSVTLLAMGNIDCPNSIPKKCTEIILDNPYVVPGSIKVVSNGKEITPGSQDSPVIVDYRGYYLGRLYIVNNDPQIVSNVTINYNYYRQELVTETGFISYQIPPSGQLWSTYGMPWPPNIFPGSEIVLASADQSNLFDNKLDSMFCYKAGNVTDDPELCPKDYQAMSPEINYEIMEEQNNYIKFSGPVSYSPRRYEYVKMRYAIIPVDYSSGSEFTKTAMDITGKFSLGKKITVQGEFATTNSDLATTYSSDKEIITIDAYTGEFGDDDIFEPVKCKYYGISKTYGSPAQRELVCRLRHGNLTGEVTIEMRHCERVGGQIINDCIVSGNSIVYQSTTYSIPRLYFDVDKATGDIIILRKKVNPGDPEIGFSDPGNYFPSRGDQLIVNYIYDKALNRLVDGFANNVRVDYRSKILNASFSKDTKDPFFDTSLGGSKQAMSDEDRLGGNINLNLRKWVLGYTFGETEKQTIDTTSLKPTSINTGDTTGYSATYSGKGHLTALMLSRTATGNNTVSGINSNEQIFTGSESITDGGSFSSTFLKTKLTLGGTFQNLLVKNSDVNVPDQRSSLEGLNFGMKLRSNLDYTGNFSKSKKTNETGGRDTKNTFHYLPIKYLDITVSTSKNVPSRNYNSSEQNKGINENQSAYFKFQKKFGRVSGLNFDLTKVRTPSSSGKNDTRRMTFETQLPYGLKWTPTYMRTTSGEGDQWRQSESKNWVLAYRGRKGRLKNATWSRSKTISKTPAIAGSATTGGSTPVSSSGSSTSGSDSFVFDMVPSTNTTANLTYNRVPVTGGNTWNFIYNYKYTSNLEMGFSWNLTSYSRPTSSLTTNYSFNSSIRITDKTHLQFIYKSSNTRAQDAGSSKSDNNFTATLNSNFQ